MGGWAFNGTPDVSCTLVLGLVCCWGSSPTPEWSGDITVGGWWLAGPASSAFFGGRTGAEVEWGREGGGVAGETAGRSVGGSGVADFLCLNEQKINTFEAVKFYFYVLHS